jgi:hypothetical protein
MVLESSVADEALDGSSVALDSKKNTAEPPRILRRLLRLRMEPT